MFDDEQTEQLQDTLDRLVAPHIRQRINGKLYGRDAYRGHVREMRATVTGGRVEVVEQVRGRRPDRRGSLFHVVRARGSEATFESSVFAELTSHGRIRRLAEVARVVDEDDQDEMLPGQRLPAAPTPSGPLASGPCTSQPSAHTLISGRRRRPGTL